MKKLLIPLLLLASSVFAQIIIPQNAAKTWMINHFQVPPDAKITDFSAVGDPVIEAAIVWTTGTGFNYQVHLRRFDFTTGKITAQSD